MKRALISLLTLVLLFSPIANAEEPPRPSTVTGHVEIISEKLTIAPLERSRTIRVYLPANYHKTQTRYPVLYMHDAQNLFDYATSYAGEWQVDETLEKLAKKDVLSLIVVGIDNGGEKRMNELSPWPNEHFGEAEGEHYVDFIVNTVKPHIDKHYRTHPEVENTAIMGSSMGGLISHYAIYKYPEVFSKAGIFSPSYWYSEDVFSFTQEHPIPKSHALYIIVSNNEGEMMTGKMQDMVSLLNQASHSNLFSEIHDYGNHNEAYWAGEFAKAIQWLFSK